jgi:Uma2 family endonuclease
MPLETAFRSEERFTQAEFRAWLDRRPASDINHYELIRGQIVMSPPSGWPHGSVGATLVYRLSAHVRGSRLGRVFDASTGYDLPSGDTLEPDVSFISNARFAAGPAPVRGQFLRIVPDLAIEILSPSSASRDRVEKSEIYAANGVDEYWIVDTKRRELTLLAREGGRFGPPQIVASGEIPSRVLPDLAVAVEEVFADVPTDV